MTRRLPRALVAAINDSPILGVRAGAANDHRTIGIWAVVVDGRVFARSWKQSAGGWYRTFLDDPRGSLEVDGRRVSIRAVRARGERLRDAIGRAYAEKYRTPASLKYVRGLGTKRRRETTIEFVPGERRS
jgi:hypothetical protein